MVSNRITRLIAHMMIILMLTAVPVVTLGTSFAAAESTPEAVGRVNSKNGAYLRQYATTSSAKVAGLRNNTVITIMGEVFVTTNKTDSKKRWYYVKVGSKIGYIRADLVKSIKYEPLKATTTKKINYRSGAGVAMPRKGTIKKGKTVKVILAAKAYGTNKVWYKIQKGTKQYYVASTSVKLNPIPTKFTLSGVTYPEKLGESSPFTLKGTINCTNPITKVEGGIVDSSGKWATSATVDTNTKSFNIATIDAKIKFGTLEQGTYYYKVVAYVAGKAYTQINKQFKVVEAKKAEKITNKAFELCWPAGTSSALYSYSGGRATDAYKKALDQAYPDRSKWGAAPKAGASCDVFVGTVLRASGVDSSAPRGLDGQVTHYPSSDKYTRVNYTGTRSSLKSGDIIIFKRNSGNTHTCIYLVRDGKEYIAEANYTHTYAMLVSAESSINGKLKTTDKQYIHVYRINENSN